MVKYILWNIEFLQAPSFHNQHFLKRHQGIGTWFEFVYCLFDIFALNTPICHCVISWEKSHIIFITCKHDPQALQLFHYYVNEQFFSKNLYGFASFWWNIIIGNIILCCNPNASHICRNHSKYWCHSIEKKCQRSVIEIIRRNKKVDI